VQEGGFTRRRSLVAFDAVAFSTGRNEIEWIDTKSRERALGHDVVELPDITVTAQGASLIRGGGHESVVYRAARAILGHHAVLVDPRDGFSV
jgi:hypothetical protein